MTDMAGTKDQEVAASATRYVCNRSGFKDQAFGFSV